MDYHGCYSAWHAGLCTRYQLKLDSQSFTFLIAMNAFLLVLIFFLYHQGHIQDFSKWGFPCRLVCISYRCKNLGVWSPAADGFIILHNLLIYRHSSI